LFENENVYIDLFSDAGMEKKDEVHEEDENDILEVFEDGALDDADSE